MGHALVSLVSQKRHSKLLFLHFSILPFPQLAFDGSVVDQDLARDLNAEDINRGKKPKMDKFLNGSGFTWSQLRVTRWHQNLWHDSYYLERKKIIEE